MSSIDITNAVRSSLDGQRPDQESVTAMLQLDMDIQMYYDYDADNGPSCSLLPPGALDGMWVIPGMFQFGTEAATAHSQTFSPDISLDDNAWPDINLEEDEEGMRRHPAAEIYNPPLEDLARQYGDKAPLAAEALTIDHETTPFEDSGSASELDEDPSLASSDESESESDAADNPSSIHEYRLSEGPCGSDDTLKLQTLNDARDIRHLYSFSIERGSHPHSPHHALCGVSSHRARNGGARPSVASQRLKKPSWKIRQTLEMEGALGVTHRESIKISSKRKKAFSLAPSSRQELQRLGKQITSESIAEQILKSTGQEESAQLCIKKPTRTKMGSKFGWTCGENGCSHVSYQENAALRHILTHMNLHVLCFGCRQSFGSSVISLKRHVEQAYRKDKTGLCVLGNPSVEKQMPTPGKKNCGNTSPWQEKRFTQSATLIERGSQFEGGARLVRIKWV